MIFSYLKTALRSLSRNRLFSFINIFGLALSLSVCLMIILRTKYQLGYDTFQKNAGSTVRILTRVESSKEGIYLLASTPYPLVARLKDSALFTASVNLYSAFHFPVSFDDQAISMNGVYTSPDFFKVFDFRLASGDPETALENPNSVVLSADAATRLFGKGDALGKMVNVEKMGDLLVTGIMEKTERKSHIAFDVYVSSATLPGLQKAGLAPDIATQWNAFLPVYSYVQLRPGVSSKALDGILSGAASELNRVPGENRYHFQLQKLTEIRPGSLYLYNDFSSGAGWTKIWTEMGIALLILLAGAFNYTNLTIARSLTRSKEVGIRKVAGARRYQIFFQYITESVCISFLALALAYLILSLILRYKPFNDGYEFMPDVQPDVWSFLLFIAFTLLTAFVAGFLPAWILSSFKPVEVLKNVRTKKLLGNISLQKVLIVFQFSLSLIILVFLVAFYRQFAHLSSVDPGFRSENIVSIPLEQGDPVLLKSVYSKTSGVVEMSGMSDNFGHRSSGIAEVTVPGLREPLKMDYFFTDADALRVFGLKLLAGSGFSVSESDGKSETEAIINEAAARRFSSSGLIPVVGQVLMLDDSVKVRITGIVKDFYYQGTGKQIRPMLMRCDPRRETILNLLMAKKDDQILTKLRGQWKSVYPHKPFSATWYSDGLEGLNNQTATMSLLGFLGLVTLVVGTLGMLGLVVYTVETRQREVSIRKIVGAGVLRIILLLGAGFLRLLLIAGCIALPLGYVLTLLFLQNFANRVSFGPMHLLGCFLFLLLIGAGTIISQTWRAANRNPAQSLRSE